MQLHEKVYISTCILINKKYISFIYKKWKEHLAGKIIRNIFYLLMIYVEKLFSKLYFKNIKNFIYLDSLILL